MKQRNTALLVAMTLLIAAPLGACDRGDGAGQKAKGQLESGVGSVTGDQHLKNQGKKDEVVGGVKKTFGDLKGAVHDASK
jgi:uncharacterized protein YjbJ (UPF0337 family)